MIILQLSEKIALRLLLRAPFERPSRRSVFPLLAMLEIVAVSFLHVTASFFSFSQLTLCGFQGAQRKKGIPSFSSLYIPGFRRWYLFAFPLRGGGGGRIRTGDPLLARQVLYQLSYTPRLFRPSVCRQFWRPTVRNSRPASLSLAALPCDGPQA